MLQKKYLENRKVEVTFRMPPLDGVVELYLCGDFNRWAVNGVPLMQEPDGEWVATLVLDAGKSYRFRYCDNQGTWHNDWEADAYVPNDYGSDDSVLDLTTTKKPSKPRKKEKAETRKATPKKGAPSHPKKAAGSRQAKGTRS
jgi:1,4-alpha-glucan branching enzyme